MASSTYEWNEKCIYNFSQETLREKDYLYTPDADLRIILNLI